jgi:folate-binding protein YgfZ
MMADTAKTADSSEPDVFFTDQGEVTHESLTALRSGAALATANVAVIEVTGPGALQCLQGLLTCDLEAPGNGSFQYGALLTPKGMIVTDMWVVRSDPRLTLYVPPQGVTPLLATFKRSLPPRSAQFTDGSPDRRVLRLIGPQAADIAANAGVPVPGSGTLNLDGNHIVARPAGDRPYVLQIDSPIGQSGPLAAALSDAGASGCGSDVLELARMLAGWPRLGAEIDVRTLPQEVNLDDLGGVSHSKGCYVGQETVSRIHFRGHVNKRVVGLNFHAKPDVTSATITLGERAVGRLASAAWFGTECGYLGLGVIRREVEVGDAVIAAGGSATVESFPLELRP